NKTSTTSLGNSLAPSTSLYVCSKPIHHSQPSTSLSPLFLHPNDKISCQFSTRPRKALKIKASTCSSPVNHSSITPLIKPHEMSNAKPCPCSLAFASFSYS